MAASRADGDWTAPADRPVALISLVVGMLAAPVVLPLMARRESGSTMARRRDLALHHSPA